MSKMGGAVRLVLPLAGVAWLALAGVAHAQGADAENDEAMRNIQSNFQRMTPPPRTVDSINQELKHDKPAAVARGGAGGGRGRGRRGAQSGQNQQDSDSAAAGGANGGSSGSGGSNGSGGANATPPAAAPSATGS